MWMIPLNVNTDTLIQLVVGVGASVLALLLMLIKIPVSEYSEKLAKSKHAIVLSFLICGFMMFHTVGQYGKEYVWDWEFLTMLMIYIVVHFSTVIVSYSMIALLRAERKRHQNIYISGLFASSVVAFMLQESYKSDSRVFFWITCIMAVVIFLIQSVTYIVYFDKAYRESLKELENYYDEDADGKLRWVRFCYVISMLTNLFVLVYMCFYWLMPHKTVIVNLYTSWYLLYMLYLTSNFLSFLGSHRIVLDAFAHKALSGQEIIRIIGQTKKKKGKKNGEAVPDDVSMPENIEASFNRLERSLDRWVKEKRFREYDKTRDDIARELHITKDILHLYFATRMGVDFRTWRTGLRIEEAKRLLLETKEASINIIAEASGFSDKSIFHRQFVKIVGCSPKDWRDSDGNMS